MEMSNVSFRCYYKSDDGPQFTTHYRVLDMADIPKWLDAYKFTHPDVLSICVKVWFTEPDQQFAVESTYGEENEK